MRNIPNTSGQGRPRLREKLRETGLDSLSIAELLAILLNTGYRGESVIVLAKRLLKEYGSNGLKDIRDVVDLRKATGLPEVKACQLVACFELGRRLFTKPPRGEDAPTIRSPEDVFDHVGDMRSLLKEQLRGLYLNARNRVVRDDTISVGTITANLVHPVNVVRPAILFSAVGVILVHNHPSGDPEPSEEDIAITKRIAKAAKLFDIQLIDHVIVAEGGFRSLSEMGII